MLLIIYVGAKLLHQVAELHVDQDTRPGIPASKKIYFFFIMPVAYLLAYYFLFVRCGKIKLDRRDSGTAPACGVRDCVHSFTISER